ncbi:MAG: hypothetical protein Q9157_009173 [Trypethelium eluteriae]
MSNPIKDYGWEPVPRSFNQLLATRPEQNKKAEPIQVDSIELPETKLAQDILDYARKELSEPTFNHSMRVYYYGRAITLQQFPHFSYTPETYLLLCLLHDIGTTPQNLHSTHLSFEFQGGMIAHSLLRAHASPVPQAEAVTEAIIRHQDLGETGNITTLGALVQLATVFDNVGMNPELVARETIESVVGKWPRLGWTACFAGVVREEEGSKPWSHTTAIENFAEKVEGNVLMRPYD